MKTAKSLVNRGRSYITQLNTINLDNVEQLSDFEYDALVSKTKALKKKVDYYFYEVKKLRAPNKHGYAFKKVLLQAAHDIKKSAQTVDTFMNNDEIENENELVELHHNHMESAHNRMKELQRSL